MLDQRLTDLVAERTTDFATVADIYDRAQRKLDAGAWAYLDGGASGEQTLVDNLRAFARWSFRPRHLTGVTRVDIRTRFVGLDLPAPILTAPIGSDVLFDANGQRAIVRAAARRGLVPVVSEASYWPLEAVASETPSPKIMQLHAWGAPAEFLALAHRAQDAGFFALCVTIDCPTLGWRERTLSRRFEAAPEAWAGNHRGTPSGIGVLSERLTAGTGSPWTWETLADVRSRLRMPVLVKGVLTADDARNAVTAGADALIVSNHGGRQLDGVPATLDQMPEVVEAVAGQVEVALDGGVRRGTDVLKALALGAKAVLLGRAVAMGLAAAGEDGVCAVLRLLEDELRRSMLLAGCPSTRAVDRSMLQRRQPC